MEKQGADIDFRLNRFSINRLRRKIGKRDVVLDFFCQISLQTYLILLNILFAVLVIKLNLARKQGTEFIVGFVGSYISKFY
jgi:hypothetical protein